MLTNKRFMRSRKMKEDSQQYNLALNIDIMSEIDKAMSGMQLLVEEYIGKGMFINACLSSLLDTDTNVFTVDGKGYTLSNLLDVYNYCINKYMPSLIKSFGNLEDLDAKLLEEFNRILKSPYNIINVKYILDNYTTNLEKELGMSVAEARLLLPTSMHDCNNKELLEFIKRVK